MRESRRYIKDIYICISIYIYIYICYNNKIFLSLISQVEGVTKFLPPPMTCETWKSHRGIYNIIFSNDKIFIPVISQVTGVNTFIPPVTCHNDKKLIFVISQVTGVNTFNTTLYLAKLEKVTEVYTMLYITMIKYLPLWFHKSWG